MTRDQADQAITRMCAVWPHTDPNVLTLSVWREHLQRMPLDIARAAVAELERSSIYWPSIAQFQEECRRIHEHRRNTTPALPAPSEPLASKDRVHDLIEQMRQACLDGEAKREAVARGVARVERQRRAPVRDGGMPKGWKPTWSRGWDQRNRIHVVSEHAPATYSETYTGGPDGNGGDRPTDG
jgi:hypothetical protein